MAKKFVEALLKTDAQFLSGFLQGYLAGSGRVYRFFINSQAGIEDESLSEKLKELIGLTEDHQRVVIEEPFLELLKDDAAVFASMGNADKLIHTQTVKSGEFALKIKNSSREDAAALKQLIQEKPAAIQVAGWQENETVNKDGKGVELYTPLHDYIYEASGSFSGEIEALIDFRRKLSLHSSAAAEIIKLEYE